MDLDGPGQTYVNIPWHCSHCFLLEEPCLPLNHRCTYVHIYLAWTSTFERVATEDLADMFLLSLICESGSLNSYGPSSRPRPITPIPSYAVIFPDVDIARKIINRDIFRNSINCSGYHVSSTTSLITFCLFVCSRGSSTDMHSFHSDRQQGTTKLPDTDSHDFEARDASLNEPILNVGGHGGTQRRLRNYQVTMIGFASGIGTGLFVGTGSAYASSGPAGLLLAYIIVGAILWCVMQSIAELATVVSRHMMFNASRPRLKRRIVPYSWFIPTLGYPFCRS